MVANQSDSFIPARSPADPVKTPALRCLESGELLGVCHEVAIRHSNEIYHLRRTRQGKLILTK